MIDSILEGMDLTIAYHALALFGVMLAVYVMQLINHEAEDSEDPPPLRLLRRGALAMLAWALLWSLSFCESRKWQPWPSNLLIIFAIDAVLFIRVLAIKARMRRTGIEAPLRAGSKIRLPG